MVNGRPLIGVPVGASDARATKLAVNRAYVNALHQAGATVLLLPPGPAETLTAFLEQVDGVLFPGGVDVHPIWYGEEPRPCLGQVDEDLDALEVPLARAAVERGLPVMGICRGHQVVNVALGGSLWQDIRADGASSLEHVTSSERGRDALAHQVRIKPGSWLHRAVGELEMEVNSFHHQAVRRVAPGLVVSAISPDGIVEGLESNDGLILTVQCHPEELTAQGWARRLFSTFVARAAARRSCPALARP
ncbi:MAG TPA: gamma-glutamyl-gamma-aminobutyrate hydrolase family protein [Candidatus Dormibacteraeota bacterium]|nr:gamma-glutamyl-gamma-aminobutyrate hydrolase family protein [Candidatus Dormibacteraeota bacterium]